MRKTTHITIKYWIDTIISLPLFILLSPLLLLIALAIKLDDGNSVFFRQERPGLNGRIFSIWKFRTMVPDADRLLDEKGCARQNRVTRIGKILRRSSLDELPQLVNILRGEMSFIGPRPALCEHVDKYSDRQKNRFLMKPGITGLAQINGRNTLKWSKRLEYDLQYVRNFSLWLDAKILFKTFKTILRREGIVLDRNPDQVYDLVKEQINANRE